MHPHRVAEQLSALLSVPGDGGEGGVRDRTLLGCSFVRDPPDATWHYAKWANGLSDERRSLERFRELTVLQPTWMLTRRRFEQLGGYVEAPAVGDDRGGAVGASSNGDPVVGATIEGTVAGEEARAAAAAAVPRGDNAAAYRLIHPVHDTPRTLRLAEDLRFFHAHLRDGGRLRVHRASPDDRPLVTYRHRAGVSQSSSTPRRLLVRLRVKAFEDSVLRTDPTWAGGFAVWGAGRDGKDFVKALSPNLRERVVCLADVDEKKIDAGFYHNRDLGCRIPVVHFSLLTRDVAKREELTSAWAMGDDCAADSVPGAGQSLDAGYGRINKARVCDADFASMVHNDATHQLLTPVSIKGKGQVQNGSKRAEESSPSGHEGLRLKKRRKLHRVVRGDLKNLDLDALPKLPVVVCVAMYRTGGVLEQNVRQIGRTEGVDLWHFS